MSMMDWEKRGSGESSEKWTLPPFREGHDNILGPCRLVPLHFNSQQNQSHTALGHDMKRIKGNNIRVYADIGNVINDVVRDGKKEKKCKQILRSGSEKKRKGKKGKKEIKEPALKTAKWNSHQLNSSSCRTNWMPATSCQRIADRRDPSPLRLLLR